MAYAVVEDFKFGIDRRRERVAGTPGTLWIGENVHVTRGGDVERRKKFVPEYEVPGTFGAAVVRNQLYVFGSDDLASSMPVGVRYQRLQAGDGQMTRVLDVKSVAGKLYVIAEFHTGAVFHFYDGSRVTDWDTVASSGASFESVTRTLATKVQASDAVSAEAFGDKLTVTALEAGTAFTISASAVDGSGNPDEDVVVAVVQANVAGVAEVRATATITITGGSSGSGNAIDELTINGVAILSSPIPWTTSNASTAASLAAAITGGFDDHGYTAAALNAVVTITAAPGSGAAVNGHVIVATPTGGLTLSASASMSGGVTEVEARAQVNTVQFIGTFQTADTFSVTINGDEFKTTGLASGTGRTAYVDKQRVWSPVDSLWRYCMLGRPDIWDPDNVTADNDAGFINVSSDSEGNENLVVASRYEGQAAIFSENGIVIYDLDTDPDNFAMSKSLENTGTAAPGTVVRFGNNDVFYLDRTGVRSLRARDSTNAPFVSDIGNAIDPFIQDYMDGLTSQQISKAISAIEPRDGRYLLTLNDRMFVLSYFPGAKISAWTYYDLDELEGDEVQAIVRQGKRLLLRAGDYVYVYGGLDGEQYPDDDEIEAVVEMPFLSARQPATQKMLLGFDLAAVNTWQVEIAYDPNNEDKTTNVGVISKITLSDRPAVGINGEAAVFAPKFRCNRAGPAKISLFALHYEPDAAT